MKNINYVVNGVLAVAVIILFILHFTGKKSSDDSRTSAIMAEGDTAAILPIAYVNMDSLLLNYNYYKDLNEIIMKKSENARLNLNQQSNSLQAEVQDFERKLNNNVFLTRERAEQEQARLMKKQQDLQDLQSRLSQELLDEQQRLHEQLRDSLVAQLKIFNQDKHYQVIFSNNSVDNILLANQVYDITEELIVYLNKNYAPKP